MAEWNAAGAGWESNWNAGWGTQPPAPGQQADDDQAYGWDDSFTCEEDEFVVLAPGEYEFTVKNFKRDYYNGSEDGKSKPCPMAKITLEINSPDGKAQVTDTLFLKKSSKWRMDSFFRAVGVAKMGQPYTPCWNNIIGMKGRARVKPRDYNGKKYNNVERYVFPKE